MKYLLIVLVLFCFNFQFFAQIVLQKQSDPVTECVVYFIDDVEKAEKLDDDKLLEGVEVGRFLPTFGGEGTLTVKRFRVGKSNLYIFASVFYEDDLFYDDILHDAMTLQISITNSASENPKPKSWLAFSGMQTDYRDDFGAANVSAIINRKGKISGINMHCQRKKS